MAKYQRGQSGNPKGRPKGIKDKRHGLRELLQPHVPALVQQAVDLALAGDTTALRLCLERVIPPLSAESPPAHIEAQAGDRAKAGEAVLANAFSGQISAGVAQQLLGALRTQSSIVEVEDLAERIEALEASAGQQRS